MNKTCTIWEDNQNCICYPEKKWPSKNPSNTPNDFYERVRKSVEILVREIENPLSSRFQKEADKWANETAHLSSPTQKMLHPSYQAILGLANEDESGIISLILQDLKVNQRPWFWALSYLTKENPIKQSDFGKLDKMIKAWIAWGKQKGYL
jgi:hypothetical protein